MGAGVKGKGFGNGRRDYKISGYDITEGVIPHTEGREGILGLYDDDSGILLVNNNVKWFDEELRDELVDRYSPDEVKQVSSTQLSQPLEVVADMHLNQQGEGVRVDKKVGILSWQGVDPDRAEKGYRV